MLVLIIPQRTVIHAFTTVVLGDLSIPHLTDLTHLAGLEIDLVHCVIIIVVVDLVISYLQKVSINIIVVVVVVKRLDVNVGVGVLLYQVLCHLAERLTLEPALPCLPVELKELAL